MIFRKPADLTTLDLFGIGFLITWDHLNRIETKLDQTKEAIMATLAGLVTDDNDLATEVGNLIAAYDALIAAQAAGTLTADQQAQVDAADATLQATKASVVAALTPPA